MSLFAELKRRNVFRAAIAYIIFAWMLLQIVDFVLDVIGSPEWILQTLVALAAVGLPVVMVFAWVFELTPDGFKRDAEVSPEASFRPLTARRLDTVALFSLSMLVVFVIAGRFRDVPSTELPMAPEPEVAATVAATIEETPSIAVLPFRDMSAAQDQAYFGEGIAEELLNGLVKLDGIKVASRTSTFSLADDDLDIPTIAERLKVNNVLEGSIRTSGNQVRVTAQLIDVKQDAHLWSETFDGTLEDLFAIQDEITDQIIDQLEVHLGDTSDVDEKAYTTVQDLTPDLYEKFLRARYLMRRRNDADTLEAVRLNAEVLGRYPDFPRGMVQQAEAMVFSRDIAVSETNRETVEALAQRALALEPDLALGHMILAGVARQDNDFLRSIRSNLKAIELDPSEPRPHHWLGIDYANVGFLEQAEQELSIAVELEPDHANANGYLGYVLSLRGEYDAALGHFERQIQLGNPFGAPRIVHMHVLKGDIDTARRTAESLDALTTPERNRLLLFLDAVEDESAMEPYLAVIPNHPDSSWHIALELYILGEFERALAYQAERGNIPQDAWSTRYAAARDLEAFMPYIESLNLTKVWDELGPPPPCRQVADGYDCSSGAHR